MRFGRRWLLAALGIVLGLGVVAQIVNANLLSDLNDATKYGSIGVPGSGVLRFPSGSIEVLVSRLGSGGPDAPPGLELSVRPVGGDGPPATLTRDRGSQFGSTSRNGPDLTYRRIFRLHVPRAGAYEVTAAAARPDDGYRLGFGNGPPISAWTIWKLTGLAVAVILVVWLVARLASRRRSAAGSHRPG